MYAVLIFEGCAEVGLAQAAGRRRNIALSGVDELTGQNRVRGQTNRHGIEVNCNAVERDEDVHGDRAAEEDDLLAVLVSVAVVMPHFILDLEGPEELRMLFLHTDHLCFDFFAAEIKYRHFAGHYGVFKSCVFCHFKYPPFSFT